MFDFALKGNILFSSAINVLEEHPHSFLICKDGVCRGVFSRLPAAYSQLPLIDYEDALIVPGLVDLHIHAPQYAFRGMGMDMELMDWLCHQAFPEEARYADLDYARLAYSIFARQLKKSATTRAAIFATCHRPATVMLMEMMEDTGLITYVGKVNMDQGAPEDLAEKSVEVSLFNTIGWLDEIKDRFERTKPILTPRFIPCCSRELLEELRSVRMTHDLPVQSHLSESPAEIELVKSLFPDCDFYGACYDRYDLFGFHPGTSFSAPTVMAHCVWSTTQELSLIKENGVFIAHCPTSNMNLSSGAAPIRKYLDNELRVGLGSDVAGGQTESMFRAVTDAIQVSKLYWRHVDDTAKPLTFPEAFYLATKGGGAFFGQVGSFEEGYEFDALVLDDSHLPHPQQLSLLERLERFAYLGGDMNGIVAKYVAGSKII